MEQELHLFCNDVEALVAYITHSKPYNLQTLLTKVNFPPKLSAGVSRGNKLTNGRRWNGKGTEVKGHVAWVAGNRLCVSSFTAFENGTLVIWQHFHKVSPSAQTCKLGKLKQCTSCPINDNLAFRLNPCTNIASVWDNAMEMSVFTLRRSDKCYSMNSLNETQGKKTLLLG